MKKLLIVVAMLFWTGAWAQEDSARELRQVFAYVMRVAELPCPEELRSKFTSGVCYRHGYSDFFNFKEAVTTFMSGPEGLIEPWHVVTMTFGGETVETVRARYRFEENLGQITLTYISENLLVLETGDVRASP